MNDSFGRIIELGMVVEIAGSCTKKNNGLWVVDQVDTNHIWLERLNKDMRKAKDSPNSTISWPLHSYMNDPWKRREINEYNHQNATIKVLCPWVEPPKKEVSNKISFQKRGIKKGEDYCSCWYHLNQDGSIRIYARHYNQHIPREIGNVKNESDSMTDYFETDSCTLYPNDKYYKEALRCCE